MLSGPSWCGLAAVLEDLTGGYDHLADFGGALALTGAWSMLWAKLEGTHAALADVAKTLDGAEGSAAAAAGKPKHR